MTMKNGCQTNRLALVGIVLTLIFLLAAQVSARDCQELSGLDSGQLAETISKMQKVLDQNPSDRDTLKCMGIAYHRMAKKNAKTYASIKKDVYTNLCELYGKAGDQAKAEKFKNLVENL